MALDCITGTYQTTIFLEVDMYPIWINAHLHHGTTNVLYLERTRATPASQRQGRRNQEGQRHAEVETYSYDKEKLKKDVVKHHADADADAVGMVVTGPYKDGAFGTVYCKDITTRAGVVTWKRNYPMQISR